MNHMRMWHKPLGKNCKFNMIYKILSVNTKEKRIVKLTKTCLYNYENKSKTSGTNSTSKRPY